MKKQRRAGVKRNEKRTECKKKVRKVQKKKNDRRYKALYIKHARCHWGAF